MCSRASARSLGQRTAGACRLFSSRNWHRKGGRVALGAPTRQTTSAAALGIFDVFRYVNKSINMMLCPEQPRSC